MQNETSHDTEKHLERACAFARGVSRRSKNPWRGYEAGKALLIDLLNPKYPDYPQLQKIESAAHSASQGGCL